MNKEKVIVLTGSFNPVTKAHLQALISAMDLTGAVKGYFVPVSQDYVLRKMYKKGDSFVIPADVRTQMLRSLLEEDSRLVISDYEISGKGDSNYTYNTICAIQKENPECEIIYLAGADKLRGLNKWHNKEDFLRDFKVVVFNRDSLDANKIIEEDPLFSRFKDSFIVFDKIAGGSAESKISSTSIRRLFKDGNLEYKKSLMPKVADIMDSLSPDDFPDVTFEDWVKVMKTNTNRHTNQIIFKRVYEENKEFIRNIDGIDSQIAKAVLYDDRVDVSGIKALYKTDIKCVNADPITVLKELNEEGCNTALLCSACETDPAGFYASGDMMNKLYENDFCRRSTLSSYLYQFGNPKRKAVRESGVQVKCNAYPLEENYGAIYSPEVLFFRDSFKQNFALSKDPFSASVISIPPLNFIKKDSPDIVYCTDDGHLTDIGRTIMYNKILTACSIALVNGHDSIVFDDFGVNSSKLPRQDVAEIFAEAFNSPEIKDKCKAIRFALSEGKRSESYSYKEKSKYSEFYKQFM